MRFSPLLLVNFDDLRKFGRLYNTFEIHLKRSARGSGVQKCEHNVLKLFFARILQEKELNLNLSLSQEVASGLHAY